MNDFPDGIGDHARRMIRNSAKKQAAQRGDRLVACQVRPMNAARDELVIDFNRGMSVEEMKKLHNLINIQLLGSPQTVSDEQARAGVFAHGDDARRMAEDSGERLPSANMELAKRIARAVFTAGSESKDRVQRIAFRGGVYSRETDLGWFDEFALRAVIFVVLESQP